MREELQKKVEQSFQRAEERASLYFQSLLEQVQQKSYVSILINDFKAWKQDHIRYHSVISFFSKNRKKKVSGEYHSYIKWLDEAGKLDSYLDRSLSYIYMRDLGKSLDSPETKERVRKIVESLKEYLTQEQKLKEEPFSMKGLYRWAQREKVETTVIWLIDKLKRVSRHLPEGMDAEHAQRKLLKIIGGVLLHEIEEIEVEQVTGELRTERLAQALKMGYAYGLTYPFIDDLLDSNVLSPSEKKQYSNLIRTTLTTGTVPALGRWTQETEPLMKYIHAELREAFEAIKQQQGSTTIDDFFKQSYVFFQSQEIDRNKNINNREYTNEDLFIPIILKSSSSRLIVRTVLGANFDDGFEQRTFYYGIYNQLADDFSDLFDDWKAGAVTPYTYYMKYHQERPDLVNPFELYWTVISYLIHDVYHSDAKTREVILDRAINSLKRFKERVGSAKYSEVMNLFSPSHQELNHFIQKMVAKADDVDFFDKLLRDQMIAALRAERQEQDEFQNAMEEMRTRLNDALVIADYSITEEPIHEAANYSLAGDGKRLRSIMAWFMAVKEYNLQEAAVMPLLKSLEYMHTASLIFDDLPAQDNAPLRRGRATLHEVYNVAVAELTGIFLTQKAVTEQASLTQFDAKTVLKLIRYASELTANMCNGQAMDLESKGKNLTLDQLNILSLHKTGLAFEASLVMPAILAQAGDEEIEALKRFASHAGITFQIKDDLLDVEGELSLLGKRIGKDAANNNATFVSVLGRTEARKAMWEHYCLAMEALEKMPRDLHFLKHFMNYIVHRDY
ncbi:polyprenyl synthetase family protein [Robertmurraya sp. DFI.2.37]|uniref:polyprenyl synthetase family protein n=1 Tax=Robertmurraya sp. DFI.2.37 TaxID=3031819 RepID=UPI00124438AC|nr:polyprenyl synthetase family protein [Robertmurraya sp. DFI.2.37]MDF1509588.1 polyprenyl synthetase family protein [Robertmurraya sp. DFI.2.37]